MNLTIYREVCADLLNGLDELAHPRHPFPGYTTAAMDRARELLARPVPVEPTTSNDIPIGPFLEQDLREQWNRQADHANDWDSLDSCEQLAWAQARAIAADRAKRAAPAPVDLDAILSPAGPYETGPGAGITEGAQLIRDQHGSLTWWAPVFGCDSLGDLLDRIRGRLLPLLQQQPTPPAEGEVGELVDFLERLGSDHDDLYPPQESITLYRAAALFQQQAAELAALRKLAELAPRVLAMCKQRNWSLHWTARGSYLHLESSELIEALRGKRGDPTAEAADVLIVLMSITENAGITWSDVLTHAETTCSRLEVCAQYPGEERIDGSLSSPAEEEAAELAMLRRERHHA